MLFYIIILVFLNILIFSINFACNYNTASTDQHYHLGLVKGIKEKRFRFVLEHPNVIGEKYFCYPQLFHWLLAVFNYKHTKKSFFVLSLSVCILTTLVFILFQYLYLCAYHIENKNLIIFYSTLVYIFTPLLYTSTNAKNIGLSARGIGLCLGQCLLYVVLLDNAKICSFYWLMILFFLLSFFIILTSTFTIQFLLLAILPIVFFTGRYEYLILFGLAILSFFAMAPTVFKKFCLGQYFHKKIFAAYLIEDFILSARPSIWRDLVFDFWVKINRNFNKGLVYIYQSPIIMATLFIPSFIFFLFSIYFNIYHSIFSNFIFFIILVYGMFIITSFRITRFIGEPERYIEYGVPIISFAATIIYFNTGYFNIYIIITLTFSSFILFLGFFFGYKIQRKLHVKRHNLFSEVIKYLESNLPKGSIVFSSSWELNRWFYLTDFKLPMPEFTDYYIGNTHIKEIFDISFTNMLPEGCLKIVKEFKVNAFIVPSKFQNNLTFFKKELNPYIVSKTEINEFIIFKLKTI